MRASTLTFMFIISEYSMISGGDGNCRSPPNITNAENTNNVPSTKFRMMCKPGYIRKAGTSNLFKCENNEWNNKPRLQCVEPPNKSKQNPTPHSTFTPSWSSHGTQANNSTPTLSGKIVSTTTHTASTTSWTSEKTTQRSTATTTTATPTTTPTTATTTEETSLTSSIMARITTSSTTEKENFTLSMSSLSPSSRPTTSTGASGVTERIGVTKTTEGITAGILIIIIIVVLALGVLYWHRRSRPREASDQFVAMRRHSPDADQPLIRTQTTTTTTTTSSSPEPTEPPVTPSEITYTDILSA